MAQWATLFPASSDCTAPTLPDGYVSHPFAFKTPSGSVAICGGDFNVRSGNYMGFPTYNDEAQKTCLVLKAGRWQRDPSRLPDLPHGRSRNSGATLVPVAEGTIVIGGRGPPAKSLVLRRGASSWEEGPVLENMDCVAVWRGTILGIKRNRLRELKTTSWQLEEEAKWPQLPLPAPSPHRYKPMYYRGRVVPRRERARAFQGCAVLNNHLIVAGGEESSDFACRTRDSCGFYHDTLNSTFSLDLSLGSAASWVEGGDLQTARHSHSLVTALGPALGRIHLVVVLPRVE